MFISAMSASRRVFSSLNNLLLTHAGLGWRRYTCQMALSWRATPMARWAPSWALMDSPSPAR